MSTEQIIKSRNDSQPVRLVFQQKNDGTLYEDQFVLAENSTADWWKEKDIKKFSHLRERIEPWLTSLFQAEHLSLLAGSGLTHSIHHIATDGQSLPGMGAANFSVFPDEIIEAAKRSADRTGRQDGNIEDQIRVANELLQGLEHYSLGNADVIDDVESLKAEIKRVLSEFSTSILDGERNVATSPSGRYLAFQYAVNFLMSFASRSGTRERLNIFTTNYDRFIECAAEIAGIHLIDRFVGTLCPLFRSSRMSVDMHYNPPGIRGEPRYLEGVARFTKLHGSIDWVFANNNIRRIGLPFGASSIDPYLDAPSINSPDHSKLMIFPNAAKDRETASYPYVELFRDFAAAICRPNTTLVTFGYSFGDEHINRVIQDMLTIPSTHLVVISFNDPLGRIMKSYEDVIQKSQITLMIGSILGGLKPLVDNFLPKPSIDRATARMADLVRIRLNSDLSSVSDSIDDEQTNEEKVTEIKGGKQ